MKHLNFVLLLLGTAGALLLVMGLCMCFLDQWQTLAQGVVTGAVGLFCLVVLAVLNHKWYGHRSGSHR